MRNIKLLRGKKGLNQQELAKELGISRQAVIRFESEDVVNLTQPSIEKFCKFFNVTPCVLYGKDNIRYMPKTEEEFDYLIRILQKEKEKLNGNI